MPHFIILWNWTEQGVSNIKQSPKRVAAFRSTMEKTGGKLVGVYYTYGKYDGMLIVEAPNDETVMSALLSVGSKGNVQTQTLKAFTVFEATKIIEQLS